MTHTAYHFNLNLFLSTFKNKMTFDNLLPSQRKALFDLIVDFKLNPADFEQSEKTAFIKHKASGFNFYVHFGPQRKKIIAHSPGFESYEYSEKYINWEYMVTAFKKWLEVLSSELSIPDVWSQIKELKPVNQSFNNIDDPFLPEEEELTKCKIEEIQKRIEKLEFAEAEKQEFINTMKESIPLMKKLTKRQWLNQFNGAIIGYIVSKTLDSEILQQIWEIVQSVFSQPTPILQ